MNIAKVSKEGDHQVVVFPNDFQVEETEFYLKKMGNTVVLMPKADPWRSLFDSLDQFSDDYMSDRSQLLIEDREQF